LITVAVTVRFLCKIVKRYCIVALIQNIPISELKADLEQYIHGVEIDKEECDKAVENMRAIADDFEVYDVNFDVICADTLTLDKFNGKMDFVVGNLPYVRVHNLENIGEIKRFSFAQRGMTDLFIVFYEIGFKMLNNSGVLGNITPSSVFNSLAAVDLRKFFVDNKNIESVVDLKHFQAFNATTYTAIMVLTNIQQEKINYYEYDGNNLIPTKVSELSYEDFYINGFYFFGKKAELARIKKIFSSIPEKEICEVKNGFGTLLDKFFIGDFGFSEYVIPVCKASTGKWYKCFYPYDKEHRLVPFEALTENKNIRKHYEENIEKLESRAVENSSLWWGFGRSQGVKDVQKTKYAINNLVRNVKDIKLCLCPSGTGVYSGLYILTERSQKELETALFSEDFVNYVKLLGKYKSGGIILFPQRI
jgi:adenine-specific DNA-methyltransferase